MCSHAACRPYVHHARGAPLACPAALQGLLRHLRPRHRGLCARGHLVLMGNNTLTNVEALAAMLFLGWFIGFSRQIAAIEADRIQRQILAHQVINPAALDKMIDAEEQAGFSTVLTDMSSPMLANEAKNAIQSLAK